MADYLRTIEKLCRIIEDAISVIRDEQMKEALEAELDMTMGEERRHNELHL